MRSYPLLPFRRMSQRMRASFFWLAWLLFALGLYDLLVAPVMGDAWYWLWMGLVLVLLLWFYYARLLPRAAVQPRGQYFVLQGPVRPVKMSYGRIHTITPVKLAQHLHPGTLRRSERDVLEPYLHMTAVFVSLSSMPRPLQKPHLWFPRWLFSPVQPGLLLVVNDWLALSRELEEYRAAWRDQRLQATQPDRRSLAARVLQDD